MASQLAPHLAWSLSAAEIRAAVGDDAPDVRVRRPARRWPGGALVRVTWIPEADRVDLDGEPILVVVSPVPLERRALVRVALRTQVLPDLGGWIRAARAADAEWKAVRHVRRYAFGLRGVTIEDRDGRGLVATSEPH